MEKYAPGKMELAPRDVVSRAEQIEIDEGRGINGQNCVHLDLRHLGKAKIMDRLPQVYELAYNYLHVDSLLEPIPIQPTAHYSMGGIPANLYTEVIKNAQSDVVEGLYAAGETACHSLHGANRLGTNSLQEAATFGRLSGEQICRFFKGKTFESLPAGMFDHYQDKINRFLTSKGKERHADIRQILQENMSRYAGVFRVEEDLKKLKELIEGLQERFKDVAIDDKGMVYNLDLIEAIEVGNLLDFSAVLVEGALARKESRGAHYRTDFPERDDKKWLKHTMAWKTEKGVKLDHTKEVVIDYNRFPPKERKY